MISRERLKFIYTTILEKIKSVQAQNLYPEYNEIINEMIAKYEAKIKGVSNG